MSDEKRFDEAALLLIHRVGSAKLVYKMAALFSRSAPERMHTIELALSAGNASEATNAAHSLKSSAGQLGALRLQDLCTALEAACEAANLPLARELALKVSSEVPEAVEWITNWRTPE